MKILALDLGKFKTLACIYIRDQHGNDSHTFVTVETFRTDFSRVSGHDRVHNLCHEAGRFQSSEHGQQV